MRHGLGHFAPGYLVGPIVLAGLALLPSPTWAAPGEPQTRRGKDWLKVQAQPGVQERQAPKAADARAERPADKAPAQPAAAGEPSRRDRRVFTPAWPQTRPTSAPGQTPAPRATPNGNSRQPGRLDVTPQPAPMEPRIATPRPPRAVPPERPAIQQVTPRERPALRQPQVRWSPAASPRVTTPPVQPSPGARRLAVPEANFRGAGSEASVQSVAPSDRKLSAGRRLDWVRRQNSQPERLSNAVPRGADLLRLSTPGYHRAVGRFGAPESRYVVRPGAAWGNDFFRGARHHRTVVVVNLYYPFYYSDPEYVGFSYAGYYPSVYSYLGWSPGWVYPERVYYAPTDYVYAVGAPVWGHRLDARGARRAIDDVREAWLSGDIDPLAWHLTDQLDVRVYFEGKYAYTTATDDFYAMTLDALAAVQTRAMDFDDPIWISSHEVFYTGWQVFDDPDGVRHTVYVSFRFRNLDGEWYLVAVGSSRNPIEHHYTDFRDR